MDVAPWRSPTEPTIHSVRNCARHGAMIRIKVLLVRSGIIRALRAGDGKAAARDTDRPRVLRQRPVEGNAPARPVPVRCGISPGAGFPKATSRDHIGAFQPSRNGIRLAGQNVRRQRHTGGICGSAVAGFDAVPTVPDGWRGCPRPVSAELHNRQRPRTRSPWARRAEPGPDAPGR